MNKTAALVNKLYKNTVAGALNWSETEKEGAFQTSFSNYALRIETERVPDPDATFGSYRVDYVVSIFDSEGRLVEAVSDVDIGTAYDREFNSSAFEHMKELHETARRQAMGVEQALDSLLAQLKDEDDLPF